MAKRTTKAVGEKAIRARRKAEHEDDEGRDERNQALRFWTAETGVEASSELWAWIDRLRPQLVADNFDDLIHEAIYEGRPLSSVGTTRGLEHLRQRRQSSANFNLARSMVDTATARLTKRRPMPCISADDAGWTEKLFAKRVSRILRRKMGGSSIERQNPDVIRDMIIRGDGVWKVIRNGGDVDVDRIPIFELVYDPREAYYANTLPRTLAHHRPMSRDVLCAMFPEHVDEIMQAATFRRADMWTQHAYQGVTFADHVEVAEAWHLPSGAKARDGQHIIAIRGCTLMRKAWKRQRYPIIRTHWSAPIRGFRGHGLVEDLAGIQAKINDILRDAQENLWWSSSLKIFVPRGAGINKHHLRARNPIAIEYDGALPTFSAGEGVSQVSIQILTLLFDKAYELSGISQMSAASKSTLGSNASGKALDTMEDIQSDRFAQVESGYMTSRVELGQGIVDEARSMYEECSGEDDEYPTFDECPEPMDKDDLAPWIRDNEWDKVRIDEGDFTLTMEPINFLPDTRAGKLSFVAEMSKAGLIPDPTMTADLFDEPDIAKMNRSTLGPKHNIDRALEGIADPSVPMLDLLPDSSWNLPLAILMAKGERNDAQSHPNCPPEVLERFDAFLQECKRLTKLAEIGGAASLPGMQAAAMGASPNAADVLPAMGAPMPAPGGAPVDMGMMQGVPAGMPMQ